MDIRQDEVDYESLSIESYNVNPYELVLAVSKEARKINHKAQKYLGPEVGIKPVNLALKKLDVEDISFEYLTDDEEAKEREAAMSQTNTFTRPPMPSVSESVVEEKPEVVIPEVASKDTEKDTEKDTKKDAKKDTEKTPDDTKAS
jgi:DNA-directed RNA polymerase subunit K/omega